MPAPMPRRRAPPTQAAMRKYRSVGGLQAGPSTEEIAGIEGLSRSRARELIVAALSARERDLALDPRQLAELRLAPALKLAARKIAEGDLGGIDRTVKGIERLMKLRSQVPPGQDENVRVKRLANLNLNEQPGAASCDRAEKGPESPASF